MIGLPDNFGELLRPQLEGLMPDECRERITVGNEAVGFLAAVVAGIQAQTETQTNQYLQSYTRREGIAPTEVEHCFDNSSGIDQVFKDSRTQQAQVSKSVSPSQPMGQTALTPESVAAAKQAVILASTNTDEAMRKVLLAHGIGSQN